MSVRKTWDVTQANHRIWKPPLACRSRRVRCLPKFFLHRIVRIITSATHSKSKLVDTVSLEKKTKEKFWPLRPRATKTLYSFQLIKKEKYKWGQEKRKTQMRRGGKSIIGFSSILNENIESNDIRSSTCITDGFSYVF